MSRVLADDHQVRDLVRPQHDQHHAGGEVRQRALQREADREAGGTEHRDDGRGLDPDRIERRDHEHDEQHRIDDVAEELPQRDIHLAAFHHAIERTKHRARDPAADQEDDQREQDLDADGQQIDIRPRHDILERDRHLRSQGGGFSAFAR